MEESSAASLVFIDLAGFSATTEVYGNRQAIAMPQRLEAIVHDALGDAHAPVKWIGGGVKLDVRDCATILRILGVLLPACRAEPRLPLTRTGMHLGPVIRRGGDYFGSTVNITARITAIATPGPWFCSRRCADAFHRNPGACKA